MRFADKVALVTGGNSGIGKATAAKFASEGAKVVIAARRLREGEAAAEEIRQNGGDAIFIQADVSRSQDVKAAVDTTVESYGRLDFAFNNAGILTDLGPMHEIEEDSWDQAMAINLRGIWLCLKYQVRQMLEQAGGAIVNDSSVGGLRGARGASAYSASKHGVIGLTKSAALEYIQHGIRINAVCPGFIDTAMTEQLYDDTQGRTDIVSSQPSGRGGRPDEVAEAVTWLCSDAASFITGVALPVDGGILAK